MSYLSVFAVVRSSRAHCDLGILLVPNWGSKGFADANTNTNSCAHYKKKQENLGNYPLAWSQSGHDGEAALHLGFLGLVYPVFSAWPDGTILAIQVVAVARSAATI